jgi:hypothetical protein
MSKQAMGNLVDQCEAWGLVIASPTRGMPVRAGLLHPGRPGLARSVSRAVNQAEREFRSAVGEEVATVVALGLEAYAS